MAFSLAPASAVDLPRKAAPLTISMAGGKQVQLASYKGKAVLLAFILTTCPHCQYTTALLKNLQTEYGPKGLQILEAAIDQDAAGLVAGFVMHFGPNFPVGYVAYDTSSDFLQHNPMLIMHVPALVFIDRQGVIQAEYEGDDKFFADPVQEKNLRAQIEKLVHSAAETPHKTAPSKSPAHN
jgi:thiol-disulfide isomerase/thioredoxin